MELRPISGPGATFTPNFKRPVPPDVAAVADKITQTSKAVPKVVIYESKTQKAISDKDMSALDVQALKVGNKHRHCRHGWAGTSITFISEFPCIENTAPPAPRSRLR